MVDWSCLLWPGKEGEGGGSQAHVRESSPEVTALSLLKFSPSFFRDVISEFLSDRVWHSTWL